MHWKSFFLSFYCQDHRQSHGASREPLLENITSDYDLELFRKAQARASDDLVREKAHHHPPPLLFSASPSFLPPPPLPFSLLFVFFSVSVRKPSPAATGGVCDIFGSLDNHFRVFFFFCSFLCFIYSLNNHIYGFVCLSWLTTNTLHLFLP